MRRGAVELCVEPLPQDILRRAPMKKKGLNHFDLMNRHRIYVHLFLGNEVNANEPTTQMAQSGGEVPQDHSSSEEHTHAATWLPPRILQTTISPSGGERSLWR